jgi:hypothetical protein
VNANANDNAEIPRIMPMIMIMLMLMIMLWPLLIVILMIMLPMQRVGKMRKLPSPSTTNSSGRAGLPKNPHHQKCFPGKLLSNRHSLGRRHIGTLGPHHLGCFPRHDCPNNRRRTNTLDNPTSPQAGTSQYGWNNGSNQRRPPHLGREKCLNQCISIS